jgi:hypothetical protein
MHALMGSSPIPVPTPWEVVGLASPWCKAFFARFFSLFFFFSCPSCRRNSSHYQPKFRKRLVVLGPFAPRADVKPFVGRRAHLE